MRIEDRRDNIANSQMKLYYLYNMKILLVIFCSLYTITSLQAKTIFLAQVNNEYGWELYLFDDKSFEIVVSNQSPNLQAIMIDDIVEEAIFSRGTYTIHDNIYHFVDSIWGVEYEYVRTGNTMSGISPFNGLNQLELWSEDDDNRSTVDVSLINADISILGKEFERYEGEVFGKTIYTLGGLSLEFFDDGIFDYVFLRGAVLFEWEWEKMSDGLYVVKSDKMRMHYKAAINNKGFLILNKAESLSLE